MSCERRYTGSILFTPAIVSTPQIILDCAAIYAAQSTWIATYAGLPGILNPPPIFYSVPGWEFFLEELQINYYAASLPSAPPPDIKANSSQVDKLNAVNAISRDWKKFELSIFQRESSTAAWQLIAIENLHNYGNRYNYLPLKNPFLTQGDVAILGKSSQLAIQFRAEDLSRKIVMPTTKDVISIRGSWRSVIGL
jgi:hypothetical protein